MVLDRELRPMRFGAQSDPQGYAGRLLLEHPQPNSAVTPLINPQGAIHIEQNTIFRGRCGSARDHRLARVRANPPARNRRSKAARRAGGLPKLGKSVKQRGKAGVKL